MSERRKEAVAPGAVSAFCAQAALLLSAGVPLCDGLESLAEDGDALCGEVAASIARAGSLSDGLRADGRWPAYLVEMVAVGERTGRLEEALRGLSEYYAREERLRSALSGAAAYPMALGGMLLLIVLVLLKRVFPVFGDVLASLGVGMTGRAGRMMSLGAAVGWTVLVLVGAAMALAAACMVLLRTSARERVVDGLCRAIPPAGRLRRSMVEARLASVLSMTLSGGLPPEEALEHAAAAAEGTDFAARLEKLRVALMAGDSLDRAAEDLGLFSGLHGRLLRLGAAAGREEEVLARIAADCVDQVENRLNRAISVVEPALVALLSVVVGAILVSVMLPMAGILSNLM